MQMFSTFMSKGILDSWRDVPSDGARRSNPNTYTLLGWQLASIRVNSTDIQTLICALLTADRWRWHLQWDWATLQKLIKVTVVMSSSLALHFCPHEPTAPGSGHLDWNTTCTLVFLLQKALKDFCSVSLRCTINHTAGISSSAKTHSKTQVLRGNTSKESELWSTHQRVCCAQAALPQIQHILTASMTFPVLRRKAGSLLFPIWWSLILENKPQSTSLALLHLSILYTLLVLQWIIPFTGISKELQLPVPQKAGLNWRVLV